MARSSFRLFTATLTLTALSVACSGPGSTPVAPSPSLIAPDAAADGSTLKVTPPSLLSPIGGVLVTDLDPDVEFGHSVPLYASSTPALQYDLEVLDEDNHLAYSRVLTPNGGTTTAHELENDLTPNEPHRWRVRARYQSYVGPWSDYATFVTEPIAGGESCAAPGVTEVDIVVCRRAQFDHMSEEELVDFLRGIAFDLNQAGIPGGPWGILQKPIGTNCLGYSCDLICSGQGSDQNQFDVLIDAEGLQAPIWAEIGEGLVPRVCEIIQ